MSEVYSAIDSKWSSHVRNIKSYMDEDYSASLRGMGTQYGTHHLAWGRTGVEKFCSRIIPLLEAPGRKTKRAAKYISIAARDCVTYGNSSLIVSTDGTIRVSDPELSFAEKDTFGVVRFKEDHGNGVETRAVNGVMQIKNGVDREWEDSSNRVFTIFYTTGSGSPRGKSRISPSIMNTIDAASRNLCRIEEGADTVAFPQRILNGIFDEFVMGDPDSDLEPGEVLKETLAVLETGVKKVIGLPMGPDGKKMSIEEFSASDFSNLLALHANYAKDTASAFNIDVSEMGVTGAVPSSAEALYASKEDLILEVQAFESFIEDELQDYIDFVAEVFNEEPPVLVWAPPATPSAVSQADAFVKLAGAVPQLAYSRRGLLEAGLNPKTVEELMSQEKIEISPEKLKELEDAFPG